MTELSVTKRIAKNFSWLLAGNLISGAANFIVIIYIARVMGVHAFGLFQLAQAFLLYLVLFVDSGLSVLGIREIAQDREQAPAISLTIFSLRFLLAIIVFLLAACLVYFWPVAAATRWLFSFTFLIVFYRALNTEWVFQGLEQMEYNALSKIVYSCLVLLLTVWLIKGPLDLLSAPLIQFGCGLVVSLAILYLLYKKILKFDLGLLAPHKWRTYLIAAVPLAASALMVMIFDNIDTIMLGFMHNATIVGYYQAAYRVFYIFCGLFMTWLATVVPVMTKRIKENRQTAEEFLEKYLKLTALFLVPFTVLGFLTAPLTVGLLFGGEYAVSVIAFQVLIWALLPLALGNILSTLVLIPAGHFKRAFYVMAGGAGVNLILNLILIPSFSFVGAAIATIVAYVVVAVIACYLSRGVITVRLRQNLITPLIITLVSTIIFMVINSLPVLPTAGASRLLLASVAYLGMFTAMIFALERTLLFSFVREIFIRRG